jgi:hypothetical protein
MEGSDASRLDLVDPVSVIHRGLLISMSRPRGTPTDVIYVNVREPHLDSRSDADEWSGWAPLDLSEPDGESPMSGAAELPPLLRVAGMTLISVPPLACSVIPADAPFRVASDDRHVYVFRPSTRQTVYANRFVVVERPLEDVRPRAAQEDAQVGHVLEPAWEVRYRRSGKKDTPAGPKDTLGHRDMDGRPFVAPTVELAGLPPVDPDSFEIVLGPTEDVSLGRWHVFVRASDGSGVDVRSFAQGPDGLLDFDTAPSEAFTVTPHYRDTVGVTSLRCSGGVGAAVFYDEEPHDDAEHGEQTLRRAARMMVAVPVQGKEVGLSAALAVYDFGITPDGSLPGFDGTTGSWLIDGTIDSGTFRPDRRGDDFGVPDHAITVVGHVSVSAILLGQVRAGSSPALLDGADGRVHCYYSDIDSGEFMVAHFDPLVSRARADLTWSAGSEGGEIALIAERSGSTMNGLTVSVASAEGPSVDDRCTVSVDYGDRAGLPVETWRGLPRALDEFVTVLDGQATDDPSSDDVRSGRTVFYDYRGDHLQARLPLGAAMQPTGWLTIVGARPDLPLNSIGVGPESNGSVTCTFEFGFDPSSVRATWRHLPAALATALPILRGVASPAAYDYAENSGPDDDRLIGLSTTTGTVLFAARHDDVAPGARLGVSPYSADPIHRCTLHILNGDSEFDVDNLPRGQAEFVAAVQDDARLQALFPIVVPDVVDGEVTDQPPTSNLGLRGAASLVHLLTSGAPGDLVEGTAEASTCQGHTVGESGRTSDRLVATAAVAMSRPDSGHAALVDDGAATAQPGSNGSWHWQPTLRALQLDRHGAMTVGLDDPQAAALSPAPRWTVEAWARPTAGQVSRVIACNRGEATTPGGIVPSYFVGTTSKPAVHFDPSTRESPFDGSSILVHAHPIFVPDKGFTWELWVKPDAVPSPHSALGCLFSAQISGSPEAPTIQLSLDGDRHLVFSFRDDDQQLQQVTDAGRSLVADTWSHVAITGRRNDDRWTVTFYVDAMPGEPRPDLRFDNSTEAPILFIGTDANENRSVFASLNEMRYWNAERNRTEIERTMYSSLSGDEAGLQGYWPLVEDPVDGATIHNRARAGCPDLDGTVRATSNQPVRSDADGTFLSMLAGVGGDEAIVGHGFARSGRWNHLAVRFEAGTAVHLNPPDEFANGRLDFAVCGNSSDYDLAHAVSLEAHILLPMHNGDRNTIVSKWGTDPAEQSYRLAVDADGRVKLGVVVNVPVYVDVNGTSVVSGYTPTEFSVRSAVGVADGRPHHVVGTYRTIAAEAESVIQSFARLQVYVDGEEQGRLDTPTYSLLAAVDIHTSHSSVCIGVQAYEPAATPPVAIERQDYFHGVLTGVRIWNETLSLARVAAVRATHREENLSGVVAAWWFAEQSGRVAADSVGGHDATLSSSLLWVPYVPLATTTCFTNGWRVGLTDPATVDQAVGYHGGEQFTVGAYLEGDDYVAGFAGDLQEIRLWDVGLTEEELSDSMFQPLTGFEEDLVGYWPLQNSGRDGTGRGNDGHLTGDPLPMYVDSEAPISDESPVVRNVYSDNVTDFQEAARGTPSVVEYGDAQRRRGGSLFAVRKRAYLYVCESLVMRPGFRVGDLDLVYIGQVQTAPTLIGFIEGAPPVPSENLSRPLYDSGIAYNGYADASVITLTQAETTTLSFSTRDSSTTQLQSFNGSAGFFGVWEVDVGSPFFSEKTFKSEYKLGVKWSVDHNEAEIDDAGLASGWGTVKVDQLGLRGTWEPKQVDRKNYLNPDVGRRFVPDNVGYALVESLTADLYSMHLSATGQMLGKIVIPNTEIPPDRNILTFKLKPDYVKNGTLDGKVGLVDDPSRPHADNTPGSYFKAAEAYRLKGRIENENATLAAFYDQFDASVRGRSRDTDLAGAEAAQSYDWDNKVARRSLVNSYVWTASGGLHKEESQVLAERTESYAGAYRLAWKLGPMFEMKTAFKVGVYAGIDLLFGGQIDITVGKSKRETEAFGLQASVVADPMLLAWDGTSYSDEPCPGKVDGYRFMTFYLAPDANHGRAFEEEVVDTDWLDHSDDPNAIALRQANLDNKVWRVLHRVTYVSRVPPRSSPSPDATIARHHDRAVVVEDNQLLIRLVQQALTQNAPTPVEIGAAVTAVLAPDAGRAILSDHVPWWQEFVEKARDGTANPAASVLMSQLRFDTLDYMKAGYQTGALPVR